jgi:hypothetical protein
MLEYVLTSPDPESLEWNVLDDDYRRRLEIGVYYSPSGARSRGEDPSMGNGISDTRQPQPQATAESTVSPDTTKERGQVFADDKDLEFDEAPSDEEDAEIPEGSLFDYRIPGVLTKNEVAKLDLNHWRLLVRDALIELEVFVPRFP